MWTAGICWNSKIYLYFSNSIPQENCTLNYQLIKFCMRPWVRRLLPQRIIEGNKLTRSSWMSKNGRTRCGGNSLLWSPLGEGYLIITWPLPWMSCDGRALEDCSKDNKIVHNRFLAKLKTYIGVKYLKSDPAITWDVLQREEHEIIVLKDDKVGTVFFFFLQHL